MDTEFDDLDDKPYGDDKTETKDAFYEYNSEDDVEIGEQSDGFKSFDS